VRGVACTAERGGEPAALTPSPQCTGRAVFPGRGTLHDAHAARAALRGTRCGAGPCAGGAAR
jgi:hypothetical protein